MSDSFWTVVSHLNKQHAGRWFIVGSFAAWNYLSKTRPPQWTSEEWCKVVPGDVDIAISYSGTEEASVTVESESKKKFDVNFIVPKSTKLCGKEFLIKEVELVYNDASNNFHKDVYIDQTTKLPFINVKPLYTMLTMGSAKSHGKDEARKLRAAGLAASHLEVIAVPPLKVRTRDVQGGSLFAQIASLRKDG